MEKRAVVLTEQEKKAHDAAANKAESSKKVTLKKPTDKAIRVEEEDGEKG